MTKRRAAVALLMMASISATACGPSEADVSADIEEIYTEYEASLLAGDANRWVAQWTEDPIALWPDRPAVKGASTLLEAITADFGALSFSEMEISTEEVEVAGEWAYARGTYFLNGELKDGGEPLAVDGKFLTIFQRQTDGSWKIHRDIYNSNVP